MQILAIEVAYGSQVDIWLFGGGQENKQPEYVHSDWSIATDFLREKKTNVTPSLLI